MTPQSLEALATLVLALTAANERFIEILKNLFPDWLAKEQLVDGVLDPIADRRRQLRVQLLSILTAFVVAGWVAAPAGGWWGWSLPLGDGSGITVHVAVLALLTSGGAGFWNSIIDFARDAAKLRAEKTATARVVTAAIAARTAEVRTAAVGAVGHPSGPVEISIHL